MPLYYQLSLKNVEKKKENIIQGIRKLKKLEHVEGNQLKTIIREILIRRDHVRHTNIFLNEKNYFKLLLKYVIGNDYFGLNKNRKQFFLTVDRILTQCRYECIHRTVISENFDYSNIPWLTNYNENEKMKLLEKYNVFLLDFVVKPLIRHFYFALPDYKSYSITLIPRAKWNSFKDRIHNELINSGMMTLVAKCKIETVKPRGFLKIVPKSDDLELCNYRPLVALTDKNKSVMLRYKQKIDNLITDLRINHINDLYKGWKDYVKITEGRKIYGIKLDLLDAFGNVNLKILCDIIMNTCIFTRQEKDFLTKYIQEQHIFSNGQEIYQWHKGLLQGDRLSTRLCNLYLAHIEGKHFRDLLNNDHNFLHRTVDDIFFCSTDLQEVLYFELEASRVYLLNENKTVKILHFGDGYNSLCYCGHLFNLETKEVKRHYGFSPRTNIQHRFKIWNAEHPIEKPSEFIANVMRFPPSNTYFSKYLLNTYFNSTGTILINFFEGMCYVAFKFITVIDAIIYKILGKEHFSKFIFRQIQRIVHIYSRKTSHIIRTYRGPKYKSVNFELLENIACKAFIVVCKTKFSLYRFIISKLIDKSSKRLQLVDIDVCPKYFFTLPKDFRNIISRKKF